LFEVPYSESARIVALASRSALPFFDLVFHVLDAFDDGTQLITPTSTGPPHG
jgi:hypothetical protein